MKIWRNTGSLVQIHRHIAPAQQHLAFGLDRTLQLLLAGQPGGMFLGQEDHAHPVFAGRGQLDALQRHLLAVQRIRQLQQDTGPVTHQFVSAHCAPMVEIFENLQTLLNDCMRLVPLDVRHKTHAARIVLIGRVVQAMLTQMFNFGIKAVLLLHGAILRFRRERKDSAVQQQCQEK